MSFANFRELTRHTVLAFPVLVLFEEIIKICNGNPPNNSGLSFLCSGVLDEKTIRGEQFLAMYT